MRRRIAPLVVTVSLVACAPEPSADLTAPGAAATALNRGKTAGPDYVFLNGNIITMDGSRRIVSAIAVEDDHIVAVGSNGEVARLSRSNTRMVDLDGRTVLPGFVDAHTHVYFDAGVSVARAQTVMLGNGMTTLGDAFINPPRYETLTAMDHDGEIVIRTNMYLTYTDNCGVHQGDWWKSHPPTRVFGERLRVGGIKMFADGGTCGVPAVSEEFYPGSGHGDLFMTTEDVAAAVTQAEATGHQVVIHAIGDRAVRAAQDGIAAALHGGPNHLRHRIDHNSLVPEDLVGRYQEIGIAPVLFGFYHAAILEPRDDPRRGECPIIPRNAFYQAAEGNARQIIDRNPLMPVAWHGDDPWIPPTRPLRELYGMVTRIQRFTLTALTFCPPPEWLHATRVSVMEGLAMMTINSAYALNRDAEVGSLQAGKLADLIVLSHDPLSIPAEQLWDVTVGATMVGGKFVHCAGGYEPVCPEPKSDKDGAEP